MPVKKKSKAAAAKKSLAKKSPVRKTGSIVQKHHIPAEPADVYMAILDAETHTAFTGAPATCNARVGGAFTAHDEYISGVIVQLKPGARIVQEWQTTEFPKGYGPSILDLSFKKAKGGTELIMKQTKVPASQVKRYNQGWQEFYWKPLKEYFEGRK